MGRWRSMNLAGFFNFERLPAAIFAMVLLSDPNSRFLKPDSSGAPSDHGDKSVNKLPEPTENVRVARNRDSPATRPEESGLPVPF